MKQIFVDSSAFVALWDESDRHHTAANDCWATLRDGATAIFSSNFVFDETYTHLRYRTGHTVACDFGAAVRNSRALHYVRIDESLEDDAWSIAQDYSDKLFSFTDCTSFAIMENLAITEAFTFGRHFAQMGFTLLPPQSA